MNSLYADFKNQFAKVSECNHFKISLFYDQYFVQKVQLGKNILLIIVCEVNNKLGQPVLNIGQIDIMVDEYKRNFKPIDARITELNKDNLWLMNHIDIYLRITFAFLPNLAFNSSTTS